MKKFIFALCGLLTIGVGFLLFWPQPIESTQLGWSLANFAATWFDPIGLNRAATISSLEQWLNFVVFVPFSASIYIALQKTNPIWSFGLASVFSVFAELTQLVLLDDRVASFEDVFLNTAGSAVGVLLASLATALYKGLQK